MARYEWIDEQGRPNGGGVYYAVTCNQLRQSWKNEPPPKRITACEETLADGVKEEAKQRRLKKTREKIARGPMFTTAPARPRQSKPIRRAHENRTLGQRDAAEISDEGVDMFFPMEDGPGMESFVHRRLFGGLKGLATGGITGGIGGFLAGGGGGGKGPQLHAQLQGGRDNPFLNRPLAQSGCKPPFKTDPRTGQCFLFGDRPGLDFLSSDDGAARAGGGAGGRPRTNPLGSMNVSRLVCPKGYVLDVDDLCSWNLPRNSKMRKWKPGRKPMFTGGDLNAIARSGRLGDAAEEIFKKTNPAKKAVARSYRANWRKPLKK